MTTNIKTTAAAAAAALALVTAGTAGAQPNSSGTPANKGCSVNMQNPDGSPGATIVYDHGYSFSIQNKGTGKTHTFKCNNGKWEETVSKTASRAPRYNMSSTEGTFEVLASGAGRYTGRAAPAGGRSYAGTMSQAR